MLHLLLNTPVHARVRDLDADGLLALAARGAPVIDIRREDEWEMTGIIPGSRLLTFFDEYRRYDLEAWLDAFDQVADRGRPFVLVCRNSVRTRWLGRYLDGALGWPGVHHLHGGLRPWAESGRPLELAPEPGEQIRPRTIPPPPRPPADGPP